MEAMPPSGWMNSASSSEVRGRDSWILVSENLLEKSEVACCRGLRYGEPFVVVYLTLDGVESMGVLVLDGSADIRLALRFDKAFRGERDRANRELSGELE